MGVSYGVSTTAAAQNKARASSSTATTTTVVSGTAGRRIRLKHIHLSSDGNVYVYVRFATQTEAANRILPSYLQARVPYNANFVNTELEGPEGDALEMVTDAAVNVECSVGYDLIS